MSLATQRFYCGACKQMTVVDYPELSAKDEDTTPGQIDAQPPASIPAQSELSRPEDARGSPDEIQQNTKVLVPPADLDPKTISLRIALKQLSDCVYHHDHQHGSGRSYLGSFLDRFEDIFKEIEEIIGCEFASVSKGRWLKNQLRGEAAKQWHDKKGKSSMEYNTVRHDLVDIFGKTAKYM